jgi:hypothetical protein
MDKSLRLGDLGYDEERLGLRWSQSLGGNKQLLNCYTPLHKLKIH